MLSRSELERKVAQLAARLVEAGGRTMTWTVEPPASTGELEAAERALASAIPAGTRRFLGEVCGGVDVAWALPDEPGRPGLGVARWSVESIGFARTLRDDLAQAWDVSPASEPEEERLWLTSLPFGFVGSDHLVLDTRAPEWPVRFFSHAFSGSLHGVKLGDDLGDFVARWLDLGFVDPFQWWPRGDGDAEVEAWRRWLWR